jgi:hypothetical protein
LRNYAITKCIVSGGGIVDGCDYVAAPDAGLSAALSARTEFTIALKLPTSQAGSQIRSDPRNCDAQLTATDFSILH